MKKKIYSYFNSLYSRFIKLRGTPKEISLGFALGIFIGFSPTFGVQMIIAVFFASLLKWSKITAVFGVQITNPFTAPVIYTLTYSLGARIIGPENNFKLASLTSFDGLIDMIYNAPLIFASLTLGGILIGLPFSIAGYLIVYFLMNRYQETLKTGVQNRVVTIGAKIKEKKLGKKKRKT